MQDPGVKGAGKGSVNLGAQEPLGKAHGVRAQLILTMRSAAVGPTGLLAPK